MWSRVQIIIAEHEADALKRAVVVARRALQTILVEGLPVPLVEHGAHTDSVLGRYWSLERYFTFTWGPPWGRVLLLTRSGVSEPQPADDDDDDDDELAAAEAQSPDQMVACIVAFARGLK